MKQTPLGPLPISMKRKYSRVTAALLFASAAIICSLTVWATPPGQATAPDGTTGQCVGVPGVQILNPFADYYSCVSLGSVPGVQTPYGGLTFKYNDTNTLLIGGGANDSTGRIFQNGVIGGPGGPIPGFSAPLKLYPTPSSRIVQKKQPALAVWPENVL